jgi:hypothetical protein
VATQTLPLSAGYRAAIVREKLAPREHDRLADWLAYSPLVITTLFSKVSVPPLGGQGLGLGYPLMLVFFTIGVLTGRVVIDAKRAAYFAIMIGCFGMAHVLRMEPFSALSFFFMTVVSLLYALSVPRPGRGPEDAMRFVANYSAIIAVCGVVQFVAQFVIGKKLAFPIENFTPAAFLITGFHSLNPLSYGSSILKANGIFLLEPSFFSQLMAIGLIVEMAVAKRLLRIALFTLAIVLSYSGTGLLVVAVSLPILLMLDRRLDLLAIMIGVAVLALAFAVPLKLDVFLARLQEFNNPTSSGWLRFVGWFYLAMDTLSTDTWRTLFGYGAGTFHLIARHSMYAVAEMLHSKILVEYGLLGFLSYVGFLMYCIFTSPMPIAVRIAVAALQFMAGAFAEPVCGITLTLLLLTPRPGALRDAPPRPPAPPGGAAMRGAPPGPIVAQTPAGV